jgi:hypothetical protein
MAASSAGPACREVLCLDGHGSRETEALLVEVLSDFQVSIPELGT